MSANEIHSNANSHVDRIPGVTLDDAGFIHTAYGFYHPVTGEGLAFEMPETLKVEILRALIQDGEDSGLLNCGISTHLWRNGLVTKNLELATRPCFRRPSEGWCLYRLSNQHCA